MESERQISGTEANDGRENQNEADEAPPDFEIVTRDEDGEAGNDADDAIEISDVGVRRGDFRLVLIAG